LTGTQVLFDFGNREKGAKQGMLALRHYGFSYKMHSRFYWLFISIFAALIEFPAPAVIQFSGSRSPSSRASGVSVAGGS